MLVTLEGLTFTEDHDTEKKGEQEEKGGGGGGKEEEKKANQQTNKIQYISPHLTP